MDVETLNPATIQGDRDIFYARVRSQMIAKKVLVSIDSVTHKILFTKKNDFSWKDTGGTEDFIYDGPTILFILLKSVSPTTIVGVDGLKDLIRNERLETFNHKVNDLLSDIQSNYNKIVDRCFKHDDVVMDTFDAILSTKITIFRDFVQKKKDD